MSCSRWFCVAVLCAIHIFFVSSKSISSFCPHEMHPVLFFSSQTQGGRQLIDVVKRPTSGALFALSFRESPELWGRGAQGRNRVSPHPSPPSATHSLNNDVLKMFLHLGTERPLVVSVADGRSQAVVGKSRTTGSIYLTSVSSTIAKHHQRADRGGGPLLQNQGSRHKHVLIQIDMGSGVVGFFCGFVVQIASFTVMVWATDWRIRIRMSIESSCTVR